MVSSDYLIVACYASANPSDMHSYQPMVRVAETESEQAWGTTTKEAIGTVLTDAGYCSIANLTAEGRTG